MPGALLPQRSIGENIACGQRSPTEVVRGWMNSPGHRANILKRDFTCEVAVTHAILLRCLGLIGKLTQLAPANRVYEGAGAPVVVGVELDFRETRFSVHSLLPSGHLTPWR